MKKNWKSLGLMSGTSGDGVDASLIKTDGLDEYKVLKDKYFKYDNNIYRDIHSLKEKIHNVSHLEEFNIELNALERKITIFHAKLIEELKIDDETIIGFHGQTIYHNFKEKISRQLGNVKLLGQLTKKKIVYDFRSNDILNGGQGAPLTPVFHRLIASQNNIDLPVCFLNIGGISNITIVKENNNFNELFSKDLGPGNCLIDAWVRNNSNKKFDEDGILALSGTKNEIIYEQAQELYANRESKKKLSFNTNDFDVSFARGLSLEDGVTTLTDFTASVIGQELSSTIINSKRKIKEVLICGGGRKNKVLFKKIKENLHKTINLKLIDDYNVNGDFIESQAFAYLAVRSMMNLPISFPSTTGCKEPTTGGKYISN